VSGITCNLCGHDGFRVLESNAPPYRVLRCRRCRLVFVDPVPPAKALHEHYNGDYYHEWIDAQRERRLAMWEARLDRLGKWTKRGRLLDVGCGEGTFLELAGKRGWDVQGTELSRFAADYASRAVGREIFCGELAEARFRDGEFDAVTLWHVLEHVTDPRLCLSEVRRILKPSGILIVAVPNVNDLAMQVAYRVVRGKPLRRFSPGDREIHLYHFSAETLIGYMEKSGFCCRSMGPDYGIIEPAKKWLNAAAVVPYHLFGLKIFNAIEAVATPEETQRA
jgi:2-polyprenyl-3-methyl-5-hydroxy-6-metoxy-1,4-benzoquinol methylase